MRKIVLLMHVSLDGFVAGPNGEMDWIALPEALFDHVTEITDTADTALYGAHTYKLMEDYWPTAGTKPGADKHDIEHSKWTNAATKLVFSSTLQKTNWQGTRIIRTNIKEEMDKLKSQPGKDILMFGSPTLAQNFMSMGLFDEYRLNVNPIILGKGIKLFGEHAKPIKLELKDTKQFDQGVIELHYVKH